MSEKMDITKHPATSSRIGTTNLMKPIWVVWDELLTILLRVLPTRRPNPSSDLKAFLRNNISPVAKVVHTGRSAANKTTNYYSILVISHESDKANTYGFWAYIYYLICKRGTCLRILWRFARTPHFVPKCVKKSTPSRWSEMRTLASFRVLTMHIENSYNKACAIFWSQPFGRALHLSFFQPILSPWTVPTIITTLLTITIVIINAAYR